MRIDEILLQNNKLFRNINPENLNRYLQLDSCIIGNYKKGALIIQEGDSCNSIGLVLSGELAIQQITPDGEILTILMLQSGDIFGTALFSLEHPVYPFTLTTLTEGQILYIPFSQISCLIQNDPQFTLNYIAFLSSRVMGFKNKLKMLQYKDVRSRLIFYLSAEYKKTGLATFRLPHKKNKIAEMIGVARPSVSRELKHMEEDSLIRFNGDIITLLKTDAFS